MEYLGGLIKRNNLDPIHLFDEFELELCLKRATIKLPRKPYGTPNNIYRKELLKVNIITFISFFHVSSCHPRLHYIEFLVALINKHTVDPIPIMDVHDLQIVLQRGQKAVPEYEIRETEEQYRQRLIEVCTPNPKNHYLIALRRADYYLSKTHFLCYAFNGF